MKRSLRWVVMVLTHSRAETSLPTQPSRPTLTRLFRIIKISRINLRKLETSVPPLGSTPWLTLPRWSQFKAAQGKEDVVMFVVYDLPNRDCDAGASNGEINCEDSTCTEGLNTYKTQYVGKVVE